MGAAQWPPLERLDDVEWDRFEVSEGSPEEIPELLKGRMMAQARLYLATALTMLPLVSGCGSSQAHHSPPPVVAVPAPTAQASSTPAGPLIVTLPEPIELPYDQRRTRTEPKPRKLLMVEIANVERLYATTPRTDPDRPQLLRRLAEGYVELAASAFRDRTMALGKGDSREAVRAAKVVKAARREAIKRYGLLLEEYEAWCAFPRHPRGERSCADETRYRMGRQLELAGDRRKARQVYNEVIRGSPEFSDAPLVAIRLGELLYASAARGGDAELHQAAKLYQMALEHPPPRNQHWGYAMYKLGYVEWRLGSSASARERFEETVRFAQEYPQLLGAEDLEQAARAALDVASGR